MKILVTAFDPFGSESINPAQEAVRALSDNINNAEIIKLYIPTVFNRSLEIIYASVEKEKPDIVLSIGQAGGRNGITPERVAINIDDAPIADNAGNIPVDRKIFSSGEAAYFSALPVKAMVEYIKSSGFSSHLSNSAGTFVCNHVMYGVLHYIKENNLDIKSGFIHVPYIKEQIDTKPIGTPYMELSDITAALTAAIMAIIENSEDISTVGGTLN